MRRFFTDSENIGEDSLLITSPTDVHHIRKVLRLKVGQVIQVSDSLAWEYEAEITSIEDGLVRGKILDKQRFSKESNTYITLFQGVPKQGKMEVIVQKTVELGVGKIVPVFTSRSVVVDNGNFSKKIQRWQKVAEEAGKQCGRGVIPEVHEAIDFSGLLSLLKGGGSDNSNSVNYFDDFDLVLFPYENEEVRTIKDALSQWVDKSDASPHRRNVAIIIGPEGGFSVGEAEALVENGAVSVSLGRTILRTETAGMAGIAMVMYELEM